MRPARTMKVMLAIVALSVYACSAQPVDPLQPVDLSIPLAGSCKKADHYFGQALAPIDPGVLRELSGVLTRLEEPPLSCARSVFDEEYRLFETFPGPPATVRVWRSGSHYGATVVTSTVDALGSIRSVNRSEKTVGPQQWWQFVAAADHFNLWRVPPLGPLGPPVQLPMVAEPGPSWVLEGHKNDRYHAIRPDAGMAAFRQFRRAFYAAVDQQPPFELLDR